MFITVRFNLLLFVVLSCTVVVGCSNSPDDPAASPDRTEQRQVFQSSIEVLPASRNPIDGYQHSTLNDRDIYYDRDNPILTTENISSVQRATDNDRRPALSVTLTEDASNRLEQYSSEHVGDMIVALVDGTAVSAPVLQSTVNKLLITGLDKEQVKRIVKNFK